MTERETMPLGRAARDRRRDTLRDQQRLEAARLDAVITAERALAAEQHRAAAATARIKARVERRRAIVEEAIVALVDTSGLSRSAVLLDRAEAELVRLQRRQVRRDSP